MTDIPELWKDAERTPLDFIIVGAGAGGAPLAARLVERGYTVLIVEMGPANPPTPANSAVENTQVPLLHGETTEDPRHSLRYFVKHFDHDPESSQDPKVHRPGPAPADPQSPANDERGVFYPRAQGIGGCTIHNAMITICGPSENWDEIAELTGDESWRGLRMRAYFERLERCHYNRPASLWGRLKSRLGFRSGWEDGRHGQRGWLDTTLADINVLLEDTRLLQTVVGGALGTLESGVEQLGGLLKSVLRGQTFPYLDPNHWQTMRRSAEGLSQIPCAISPQGERSSPRDRLRRLEQHAEHRQRLHVLTGACVTGVALQDDADGTPIGGKPVTLRATGIRCLVREHVYQADMNAQDPGDGWSQQELTLRCRREVILCGGTFNTPQLLMLSGIGPAEHLRNMDIDVRLDLPGVGRNLQDRYEVPVLATISGRFRSLDHVGLTSREPAATGDPLLQQWKQLRGRPARERGLYATNGGLIGIFKRSRQEDAVPDLFIFALAGNFPGYSVGWSKPSALAPGPNAAEDPDAAADHKRSLTWLVLKARTRNNDGYVRLRDKNPFRRPEINFRSFQRAADDNDLAGKDPDLEALLEGVEFIERFLKQGQEAGYIERFELPPEDERRRWIKHVAWGHHACGTCRVGADTDDLSVLDSRFRVRGVRGLRVVDASVFPSIPGYFIVTNIYMAAEKAADVLAEDHRLDGSDLPPEVRQALHDDPVYPSTAAYEARRVFPRELEEAEARLIAQRRQRAYPATRAIPPVDSPGEPATTASETHHER
ncbi:MAG: GMC family oxidoreductase N-terminal domain-containing protein [Pirellulaceae bacterium]|nr:GMC family oxidoreductase N-terminal domain-containing protein [Pirellulaceae bacterium]